MGTIRSFVIINGHIGSENHQTLIYRNPPWCPPHSFYSTLLQRYTVPEMWSAPINYDWGEYTTVESDEVVIPCSEMVEPRDGLMDDLYGDLTGMNEHPLVHDKADGRLYIASGWILQPYHLESDLGEGRRRVIDAYEYVAVDQEGIPLQPLSCKTYTLDHPSGVGDVGGPLLTGPALVTWYQDDVEEALYVFRGHNTAFRDVRPLEVSGFYFTPEFTVSLGVYDGVPSSPEPVEGTIGLQGGMRYPWHDGESVHWAEEDISTVLVDCAALDPKASRHPNSIFDDVKCSAIRDQAITYARASGAQIPSGALFYATQDAVAGLSVCNINGVAYIRDLLHIREAVAPIIALIRKPLSMRSWAALLLWYKYGVKLTVRDTAALVKGLSSVKTVAKTLRAYVKFRNSLRTIYGTYHKSLSVLDNIFLNSVEFLCHSRVIARWKDPTKDELASRLAALANDLDFRLNAENAWDLVPFSFVVDWFIDFGSMAEALDTSVQCDKLELYNLVYSYKTKAVTLPHLFYKEHGLAGHLNVEHYQRSIRFSFPSPHFDLGSPATFLKHIWEGILLILSRGK